MNTWANNVVNVKICHAAVWVFNMRFICIIWLQTRENTSEWILRFASCCYNCHIVLITLWFATPRVFFVTASKVFSSSGFVRAGVKLALTSPADVIFSSCWVLQTWCSLADFSSWDSWLLLPFPCGQIVPSRSCSGLSSLISATGALSEEPGDCESHSNFPTAEDAWGFSCWREVLGRLDCSVPGLNGRRGIMPAWDGWRGGGE